MKKILELPFPHGRPLEGMVMEIEEDAVYMIVFRSTVSHEQVEQFHRGLKSFLEMKFGTQHPLFIILQDADVYKLNDPAPKAKMIWMRMPAVSAGGVDLEIEGARHREENDVFMLYVMPHPTEKGYWAYEVRHYTTEGAINHTYESGKYLTKEDAKVGAENTVAGAMHRSIFD